MVLVITKLKTVCQGKPDEFGEPQTPEIGAYFQILHIMEFLL